MRFRLFTPFLVLLLALAVPAARAVEIPLAQNQVAIPLGQTRAFEFGTVPQAGTTVLLEVEARLDAKGLGGSMFFMKLTLNGHEVKAARSRSVVRLVNKPLVSPVTAALPSGWFGNGGWRVLYAPDFKAARKHTFYTGNPYRTVLDVTDLTNPAAENRLEITNTFPRRYVNFAGTKGDLVIGKLVVRTKPQPSPTMVSAVALEPVINRGEPVAGPARYRGELMPGGGFVVHTATRRWAFDSAFSYPNAGLNRLTPTRRADHDRQAGWTVRVTPSADGGTVLASGPDYRVGRTVRFTRRKVEVADAITNAHRAEPLGLLVRHQVSLGGIAMPQVRLAGNPDPAVNDYYSPPNPSVHIAIPGHGLGLLCEDDVFRNQARLFYDGKLPAAGIRTEMLRLAPGETYTLRWSVYPVASRAYYDFINLVRHDWGANFTVEGPWTFFSPDTILATPVEKLRDQFVRLGIGYAVYCGGWVDWKTNRKRIGFGTGVLDDYWASFRTRLRRAAARIRQAAPGVKVLVYYDTQRDTSEGGHERFRDSWLTNAKGQQLSTEWSGRYSLTWSVVATLSNSYGKAMLAAADRYLDEMKIDGIYWDEMECVAYGSPLITHNVPDGHSCILDPKTYTIRREVGITTLLGEGHRLVVIDRVRRKGGFLMGNGPPFTRAILATGVQRMVEIQHNDHWCHEGDLSTPLGYASSRMDFGNWIRALRMAKLLVGTRYTYEHEISPYVFPFTPIELHRGALLGHERIITIHAGSFGWPGERCLVQVRHFDTKGKLTSTDYPTTIAAEARTAVSPADGEAVVLERLPVAIDPLGGVAEVSHVSYSAKGLSLRLTTRRGATLRIADGAFRVRAGGRYTAQVGDGAPKPLTMHDGMLTLAVPPGRDVLVRVASQTVAE